MLSSEFETQLTRLPVVLAVSFDDLATTVDRLRVRSATTAGVRSLWACSPAARH